MMQTLKVKIAVEPEQSEALLETMHQFNAACNYVAEIAFQMQTADKIKLQPFVYHDIFERGQRSKPGPRDIDIALGVSVSSGSLSTTKQSCPALVWYASTLLILLRNARFVIISPGLTVLPETSFVVFAVVSLAQLTQLPLAILQQGYQSICPSWPDFLRSRKPCPSGRGS